MSRSRPATPLRDDLPEPVRLLLTELRGLKEESGYDLRALERKTHASRSSWGRWLSGETWIPMDAVGALAALCGADRRRLEVLWEVADQARRSPASSETTDAPVTVPERPDTATDDHVQAVPVAGDGGDPAQGDGKDTVGFRTGRRQRLLFAGAIVGCALTAGAAGMALGATLKSGPDGSPASGKPTGAAPALAGGSAPAPVIRRDVIARARTWHPHAAGRVPYDQAASFQGYRTDGSGYASMALGLPKPGPNSAALVASYCRRVPASSLGPGDLVINATGDANRREVMIFERWTDASHTAYWAYQQRRGYGTDHLIRRDVPREGGPFQACRPKNLHEDPVG
ncbi:helix-turn-helix domain-containing protein [Actinomadura fibrosa]|uniref:Helix-turn-helix domain-containing protein n=1 Tax=Actinomadura fibrosa TaxID=111802 RepID=A0ABW2XDR7_9ACTN|nr:helix-turn-helix transcriptional regulator [Actinomadura fibrosa]